MARRPGYTHVMAGALLRSGDSSPALRQQVSVFCDESCHLLNDWQGIMVLGAVWCPAAEVRRLALRLRRLKVEHGLSRTFESKWTKISPAKTAFYTALADLFFDEPCLHFRGLVVVDKAKLDHVAFGQTHDDWYYKMYFRLLHPILRSDAQYRIYLDIKDTRSATKIRKLGEVLANANLDFDRSMVRGVDVVRSHEVELVQLADLLIGAIAYRNRNLHGNAGKEAVLGRVMSRSGKSLVRSTILGEQKLNLFVWTPQPTHLDAP